MSASFNNFFILVTVLLSCSTATNYEKAYGFEKDGKTFIKLKGKRQLAAHDPSAIVSNKTYEDSLIIQIPSLRNGIIKGEDIPVSSGQYKYAGNLTIKDEQLLVSLRYVNSDDKKLELSSWNGKYSLARN